MNLDLMEMLKVVFLGIVEGITEWPPISSTGHMPLICPIQVTSILKHCSCFAVSRPHLPLGQL